MTSDHDLLHWLTSWAEAAEQHWQRSGSDPALGWYGSGFNAWGVQTNQKYLATLATVAHFTTVPDRREWAAGRAMSALRFSLASHLSGEGSCADGQSWGHTWISALGIERMMFAVGLLRPWLTATDLAAIDRLLLSECRWIMTAFHRGDVAGVVAGRWNGSGRNAPESNLWNGALLWRTAVRLPDDPNADAFRERACEFLINSVSVTADATDPTVIDGKAVAERHLGANFFDNYALDHHGYLNVGYMVICVSNAAMLHFDLRRQGQSAPESLHHHQADLWQRIRRMISSDGRLLRIGGDSRVRYAYCQEYLLPSLMYAADQLRDPDALELLDAQLRQLHREQEANGDGTFYGRRLRALARTSPYYYTRLETDRACALAMTLAHRDLVRAPQRGQRSFEQSVAGGWADHGHSAVLHRSRQRFASFAWRANGLSQGLCVPPDRGDLAEWEFNLSPVIRTEGTPVAASQTGTPLSRALRSSTIKEFAGGFLTYGSVDEGAAVTIAEGWSGGPAAMSHLALAALPDGSTVIGLHHTRSADWRPGLLQVSGLHLGVPNDVANGGTRRLTTAGGESTLSAGTCDETVELGRWATIDDALAVVALSGPEQLTLSRSTRRRGGPQGSIYVEEFCLPYLEGPFYAEANSSLVDCGFAVLAGTDAAATRRFADRNAAAAVTVEGDAVRAIRVTSDTDSYLLVMNVSDAAVRLPLPTDDRYSSVTTGRQVPELDLPAGAAELYLVSPVRTTDRSVPRATAPR